LMSSKVKMVNNLSLFLCSCCSWEGLSNYVWSIISDWISFYSQYENSISEGIFSYNQVAVLTPESS
jgi:hypothetical protein